MKRMVVGLATAMALAGPASAQMVVIDHAALVKHIETARNTLNQLQKAQQQLQEAQRLYASFNKITDIKSVAGILDNDTVQRGLPFDLGSSAKLLSTDLDKMGELGARAQDMMRSRDLNGAIAMSDAAIKMASRGAHATRPQRKPPLASPRRAPKVLAAWRTGSGWPRLRRR